MPRTCAYGPVVVSIIVACGPTAETTTTTASDAADTSGGATSSTSSTSSTTMLPASTGTPDSSSSGGDATTTGDFEFEAWYLLAVAPSLSPTTPFQFLAFARVDTGVLLELQPLSLDVGSTTEPREPLPEGALVLDSPLTPDKQQFTFLSGEYMLPGQANPVTGSNMTLDMKINGAFVDPTFACGEVDGQVLVPIMADLAGSTFAMIRLQDPDTLPLEFPTACE